MADTDKKAGDAEPETYPVERIIAESGDFLDIPSHVVAGALSKSPKKNFTLDEVKEAVAEWEDHPVEVDNPVGANEVPPKKGGRS